MNPFNTILKRWILLFLSFVFLFGCIISPPIQEPTIRPDPILSKTLIPTRPSPALTLPVSDITFNLTTRAGQHLIFSSLRLEPNEYVAFHTEALPRGIPLASGEEIPFEYIERVDFAYPSEDWDDKTNTGTWPVIVRLTNHQIRKSSLGFKAHHKIRITGDSDYGYVEIELPDVQEIFLKHQVSLKSFPSSVFSENTISVETNGGDRVNVTDSKIFSRCMYEVYCCHDETLTGIPLQNGNREFLSLRSAEFISSEEVRVEGLAGETSTTRLRHSEACPDTFWRLRGKSQFGDYEIELRSIHRIDR